MCVDAENVENFIKELSDKLTLLPRLTREIFKFLIERSGSQGHPYSLTISLPKVERLYRGDDLNGDLSLLIEAGLIDWNNPDNPGEAPYWRILFPGHRDDFHLVFLEYIVQKGISLSRPIVSLDFSEF